MGILKPPSYEHPRKREKNEQASEKVAPVVVSTKKETAKEKEPAKSKQQVLTVRTSERNNSEKVTLRLLARAPQTGQIALYDEMIEYGHTPRGIILGLFSQGLVLLSKTENQSFNALEYEASGIIIETRRSINTKIADTMRDELDKFGILSERAFGLRAGEALINIASETKLHA